MSNNPNPNFVMIEPQSFAKDIKANQGAIPASYKLNTSNLGQFINEQYGKYLAHKKPSTTHNALDMTFAEYMNINFGISYEKTAQGFIKPTGLYETLGIDTSFHTWDSFSTTLSDVAFRWIIPEIFATAVRLGMEAGLYNRLIQSEISIPNQNYTKTWIKSGRFQARVTNEGENAELGTVSFGQRTVSVLKRTMGISLTDEVLRYANLDTLAINLTEAGRALAFELDFMAVEALLQGDNNNGTDNVRSVGVTSTTAKITYADLLRPLVRMNSLLKPANIVLGNEATILKMMLLSEFTKPYEQYAQGNNPSNVQAPAISSNLVFNNPLSLIAHGAFDATYNDKLLLVNTNNALTKLNVVPLMVEEARNIKNGVTDYVASVTTGFSTLFRDARLLLDGNVTFDGYAPEFDPYKYQREIAGRD